MRLSIPQDIRPVSLLVPAADAAGRSSAFVSLKNVLKAWIVVHIDQGNAGTVALTPNQASAVAGTGAKVINAARIWSNADTAADGYTSVTEAANFTTSAALKPKIVIFEIDPMKCLDIANGFDCIRITTGASNAANITSAVLWVQSRHSGDTAQSVIAD